MRILQIINDYNLDTGGAQRVVLSLNRSINDGDSFNSEILGLCHSESRFKQASSQGLKSPYHPFALPKLFCYLRRNLQSHTILHVHLFPAMFYVAVLKGIRLFSNPIICTEHSTSNRRRSTWWGQWVDRFLYSQYDQIIAISDGTKNELLEWIPSLERKVRVVPNGIPLKNKTFPERNPTRGLILSVGRLHPAKNFDTAIKALAKITDMDWTYIIAGEGQERPYLEDLIGQLELQHRVKLIGYQNDLEPIFQQAEIFLAPSRWEGFGLSVVEAMNAGIPVAASRVPGLEEILSANSPCGLFVQHDEIESISSAVKRLLQDRNLRHKLSRDGFHRSLNFSLEKMAHNYVNCYQALAQ